MPIMRSFLLSVSCVAAALFTGSATADANATKPLVSKHILPKSFNPPEVFTISKIDRTVSLEKVYPKETWDFTIKNTGKVSRRDIYIPFETDVIERIGGFEAHEAGSKSSGIIAEAVAKESAR